MKRLLQIVILSLLLTSCSSIKLLQPTSTFTATTAPTNTPIPTSTVVPTPDLLAEYSSLVPQIPSGFEWKILPEKNLAVVIPNGWFFKEETRAELNLDGVYVTKENIDEVGRFSTGLSVFIFKDFKSNDEAEQFSQSMLTQHANLETTKEILEAWDYQSGISTIHHLRIRAEFANETEENKSKVIHYSASVANNSLYWAVFETPENLWEETTNNYGLVLDYIVVFGN
ncbi:MAG: hypothetical protein JNJ43_00375 [Anaerolineales bacterium]|nr:hypothetical protein [Anaerolineales bacterium]